MERIKQTIAKTFQEIADGLETGHWGAKPKIGVLGLGSEHGEENVLRAAIQAARQGIEVYYFGTLAAEQVHTIPVEREEQAFDKMEDMLHSGELDGAVAMHYPFPIGVATVGRVTVPASGKEMLLATTTGTASTDTVEAFVRNAVAGAAVAKTLGIAKPTIGLLNLNGARQAENVLKQLADKGYELNFAESARADGGAIMRGNDVLLGTPDVMVCDSLTGNVVIKMLAAANSGGQFETLGYGYGPGVGENFEDLILIISRASGSPLIARAIIFAAELAEGKWRSKVESEYRAAEHAGLSDLLTKRQQSAAQANTADDVTAPPAEVVTHEITGIDVLELDDAVRELWQAKIYAESGMGCTGPIIRVAEANAVRAEAIIQAAGYGS